MLSLMLCVVTGAALLSPSEASAAAWPKLIPAGYDGASVEIVDLDAAPDGSLYVLGEFTEAIDDFNPQLSAGGVDLFVARLDPAGQTIWLRTVGSTGDDSAYEIEVNADGIGFVTGRVAGEASFSGPTAQASFVASIDPDGVWRWVQSNGFTVPRTGLGLDGSGVALFVVQEGTPGGGLTVQELVKRRQDTGAIEWTLEIGTDISSIDIDVGANGQIALHALGRNLFFSGSGGTTFGGGGTLCGGSLQGVLDAGGNDNNGAGFVLVQDHPKLLPTDPPPYGECLAPTFRKLEGGAWLTDDDQADAWDSAANGTGSVYASTVVGGGAGGRDRVVIARLGNTGNVAWQKSFDGDFEVSDAPYGRASLNIDVDPTGDLYLTGAFQGELSVTLYDGTTRTVDDGPVANVFVAKLRRIDGAILWLNTLEPGELDYGDRRLTTAIAVDTSGRLYVGGLLDGTATFAESPDSDPDTTVTSREAEPLEGALAFDSADSISYSSTAAGSTYNVRLDYAITGGGIVDLVVSDPDGATRIRVYTHRASSDPTGTGRIYIEVINTAGDFWNYVFDYAHDISDPTVHDYSVQITSFPTYTRVSTRYDGAVLNTVTGPPPGSTYRIGDFYMWANRDAASVAPTIVSDVEVWTFALTTALHTSFDFEELSGPDFLNAGYAGVSDRLNAGVATRVRGTRGPRSGFSDGYIARIDSVGGVWFETEIWTIGQPVPKPDGAVGAPTPVVPGLDPSEAAAYFFWDTVQDELFAIAPVVATLEWPTATTGQTIDRTGTSDYPSLLQLHVDGAPTAVDPAGSPFSFVDVRYPFDGEPLLTTGAEGERLFARALEPGDNPYAVLQFVAGPQPDPTAYPSSFQVVRTQRWQANGFVEEAPAGSCVIGSPLSDPRHESSVPGRSGWVANATAHFDGVGVDRAYDRATRDGVILPVNTDGPGDADDMVVAWYTADTPFGVLWPDTPVRYDCAWPTLAQGLEQIVIASTLGTGPIPSVDYPSRRVYRQPDRTKPGFNPNEEHARFFGNTAYALRNDLNEPDTSDPYTIVKYLNPVSGEWTMRVFEVIASNPTYPFGPRVAEPDPFELEVGLLVQAPTPLNQMPGCEAETEVNPEPVNGLNTSAAWRSNAGFLYARRATTSNTELSIRYRYPLDASFDYDLDGEPGNDVEPGTCVPWLSRLGGDLDAPVDAYYGFVWPAQQPLLSVGQTLTEQQAGLPNIAAQAAVQVVYDEVAEASPSDAPEISAVRLYDPLSERKVSLDALPGSLATTSSAGRTRIDALPFVLRSRLSFDAQNQQLIFAGVFDPSRAGEPLLLPNIMTQRDVDDVCAVVDCAANADLADALARLRQRTRNPNCVDTDGDDLDGDGTPETPGLGKPDDAYYVGFVDGNRSCDHVDFPDEIPADFVHTANGVPDAQNFQGGPVALTAGAASGTGRVTLAFNDFDGGVVSLASIQVGCPVYRGEVIVLQSDDLFEESLTLRHSGDFAGLADAIEFDWRFEEDSTGVPPTNDPDPAKASRYKDFGAEYVSFPTSPASGVGAIDVTLQGPGVVALRDNWFVARYKGPKQPDDSLVCADPARDDYSRWAGTPDGAYAQAQLAQGWIKRVVGQLNPYDARVRDFHTSPTNTIASLITQAGARYEGPIALNPDPDNVNSVGLIEAYETLLRRGMDFSVNAGIQNGGANNQLLFAATRIADLYTLIANEAYADAGDPTIGLGTDSVFGSQATSIFAFQNQLATPLDEELALLRGRDDTQSSVSTRPFYNKLVWNFTNGDGEVAYVSTYRMTDQNVDGFIDEGDGEIFYPQGHGDAWGHYLSSMTTRYRLLRHPNFDWLPRVESVLVAGTPIPVDFEDERKFARAAAAKARAGAEIVNLTYRKSYVEDPAGQWQGYKDTDPSGQRQWGLTGWARRAGQGAYFDWLVANSMLPDVDPDPAHTGIQKIDRTTVTELSDIATQYRLIESEIDKADRGLNPIGLAKGVVPFDIDPNFFQVGSQIQGETHFEQIAARAVDALQNAVTVFDYANQQSQSLREVQDDVDALADLTVEQELDYKHRLIEIFGTPYSGDIGAGKTYPSGYTGPDLYRYQYVTTDLTADVVVGDETIQSTYTPLDLVEAGVPTCYFPSDLPSSLFEGSCGAAGETDLGVDYAITTGSAWEFVATPSMGSRSAPGEIQIAISDLLQAQVVLEQAELDHVSAVRQIEELADLVAAKYGEGVRNSLMILDAQLNDTKSLNAGIGAARGVAAGARVAATGVRNLSKATSDGLPKSVTDNIAAVVAIGGIRTTAEVGALVLDGVAEGADFTAGSLEFGKETVALQAAIDIEAFGNTIDQQQMRTELAQLVREEAVLRLAVAEQIEVVRQTAQRYAQIVAEGGRILEERVTFRNLSAASTQASRYRDATFRILRNDALQKFRAQRDLAARYVYLAASAYDYETNLLGSDPGSGRSILAEVVRERSIGAVVNGVPTPGSPGLADQLGRLLQNFDVLEGQLGFNNPQIETNRFSLRRELLRIKDGSNGAWRKALEGYRVDNLWQVPEFRQYARPFTVELLGPQPALVIPFSTTVNFGLNFFGRQLAGGDSAYDPTNFATKIRSAGVWFGQYDASGLSNTPRVYLLPVGADVMRAPSYDTLETREWRVVDQRIPEPFPVGASDLSDPDWIPRNDSLYGSFGDIRRFSSFRAYHDDGSFQPDQVVTDTRLIGRSVWNTQWLLIIPGGTLLFDPDEGLDTFIDGPEIFPGAGVRTGQGIDDIKLFFETYGYSGG
jgi:hypothetical protein